MSGGISIMEWTDERVELLKEMWTAGYSARQIAEKLGGTTRNAVIGKANRLGLSKPTKSAITRKQKREAQRPPVVEIPGPGATLLNLTSTTCRWPQGHPGEPGFAFCGARTAPGQPYCPYHASIAYQSPNKDRRQQSA